MTDAPKRLFCKESNDSWGQYGHWYADDAGGGTEYIRADLARKVKPLVWLKDPAKDAYESGDFKIYKLENERRDIWRLVQADFSTQYRGDFGGADAVSRAMDAAQIIQNRRIPSALVDL